MKHIEGITYVALCAICTGCEIHSRGNNKPVTLCAHNVTGCETHRCE